MLHGHDVKLSSVYTYTHICAALNLTQKSFSFFFNRGQCFLRTHDWSNGVTRGMCWSIWRKLEGLQMKFYSTVRKSKVTFARNEVIKLSEISLTWADGKFSLILQNLDLNLCMDM